LPLENIYTTYYPRL